MLSRDIRVVFPVHPRTKKRIEALGGWSSSRNIRLIDPVGYVEFLALQMRAALVITDSGGIQEETTYLGVPCLTVRANTERPVTSSIGTNILVGQDMDRLLVEAGRVLDGKSKRGSIPPLWDGRAAQRLAEVTVALQIERDAEQMTSDVCR